MKNLKWIAIPVLSLMVGGCDVIQNTTDTPLNLTEAQRKIAQRAEPFGLNLLDQVAQRAETDQNVILSPLSVSLAFGLLLNGADAETRTEMEKALALDGMSAQTINETYRDLLDQLPKADSKVTFTTANAIWYRNTFGPSIKPDYLNTNQVYFGAKVQGLDFSSPSAVKTINDWVKENTNGKIEKLVDQLSDTEVMYLTNALYFKGKWTHEFKASDTASKPFTSGKGTQVTVNMMQQETTLPYFENPKLQAVELPYGNGTYSMTVLLPKSGTTVSDVAASLKSDWATVAGGLTKQSVELSLPRWKMNYDITLNGVLQAMGMERAFNPELANFSQIADAQLFITEVKHKTFMEVNEEGTEAAAVTGIGVGVTSAPSSKIVLVNRPFLFVIREKSTGAFLFVGRITNPTLGQ